ncbi:MAG: hypothetical protein PVJ86_01750 [Phycisphaerales bacterium]|jgi:hypothetical protein
MTLLKCPECNNDISDKAVVCPHCGIARKGFLWWYEFRSEKKLFGLPLVHIVLGPAFNPVTGKIRIAKGIIAVGGMAVGGIAMGGLSLGVIALGGVAAGLAAFAGVALGVLLGVGGFALGFIALGGMAVGYYAVGGGAWGVHALGGNVQDPQLQEFFKTHFGK